MGSAETFWRKVERTDSGCWPFKGSLNTQGYGTCGHEGRSRKAHNVAYELAIGPIPDGMEIDHTCHDASVCESGPACHHRRCCNPAHLKAVSHAENCRRAFYAILTCREGHLLPPPNDSGRRVCRTCANRRSRKHKERKRMYERVMGVDDRG